MLRSTECLLGSRMLRRFGLALVMDRVLMQCRVGTSGSSMLWNGTYLLNGMTECPRQAGLTWLLGLCYRVVACCRWGLGLLRTVLISMGCFMVVMDRLMSRLACRLALGLRLAVPLGYMMKLGVGRWLVLTVVVSLWAVCVRPAATA